jgi:hypothetical protein
MDSEGAGGKAENLVSTELGDLVVNNGDSIGFRLSINTCCAYANDK